MLSAIITPGDPRRLPALLAALTPAAVEGLVGDLRIVGEGGGLLDALCEETGADRSDDVAGAIRQARGAWFLVMRPDFRPREGWLEGLGDHLRGRGGAAVIRGRGLLTSPALVVARLRVERLAKPGFDGIRRDLRGGFARL